MGAKLIDGKELSARLRAEIAAGVAALATRPGLAVILVGDNPASVAYVTAKERACAEAGMYSREIRLPASATEAEVVAQVAALNRDDAIHGILVQAPAPRPYPRTGSGGRHRARQGRGRLHARQRGQA